MIKYILRIVKYFVQFVYSRVKNIACVIFNYTLQLNHTTYNISREQTNKKIENNFQISPKYNILHTLGGYRGLKGLKYLKYI